MKDMKSKKLKNVAVKKDNKSFQKFLNHFNKLEKADTGFYFFGDRRVDHSYLQGRAKLAGIKQIPSANELEAIVN